MPVKVCLGFWEIAIFDGIDGIPGFPDDDAGGCPFSAIAEGIRYAADNGAKVINISLGGNSGSTLLRSAIEYAVDNGVFVSMSMGNDFEDGNPTNFPASYAPSLNGAMAVGAVGRSLGKSYFSGTGTYNEIAAPGGSIRDGGGSGLVWQSTVRQADLFLLVPRFDRYESTGFQGTSMAAPHVAGLAALLMSQGITSPSVVEQIIRLSARDLGDPGQDVEYGFGLIQPRAALFGRGIR
jgi:serine protease